jgi:hypothetical protein
MPNQRKSGRFSAKQRARSGIFAECPLHNQGQTTWERFRNVNNSPANKSTPVIVALATAVRYFGPRD